MKDKKNFILQESNLIPIRLNENKSNSNLLFKTNKVLVDFNRWKYYGRPKCENLINAEYANRSQLVVDLYNAINQLSHEVRYTTVEVFASDGCGHIFSFIDEQHLKGIHINKIEQFTSETINDFLIWVKNKPSKTLTGKLSKVSAKKQYNNVKSVLMYFTRTGRLSKDIFPYAPFVNVNRAGEGAIAYSKSEMTRIMRYLWSQLELIRKDEFVGSFRQKLSIYTLIIAAKTGRNTSTILNMKIDCISAHPLAPETHVLLTSYKHRGMNTNVQAMKGAVKFDEVFSTHKDIGVLINEILIHTLHLRQKCDDDNLFLVDNNKKQPTSFTDVYFWKAVQGIGERANLYEDNASPLHFQVKRLRKTFATRVWQLTKGDPIKTSKLLGNTTPVMNQSYLEVTPEMEKNHKYFGYVLTESLLGKPDKGITEKISHLLNIDIDKANSVLIGEFNTGVARCSDPYDGVYAKGNGKACTRFVACFKCPNQVVIESDLHRLFSFYWLIRKERGFIGRKQWKKLYSWVIKVIENEIEPAFDKLVVDKAKESAFNTPNPMWLSRNSLEAI